MGKSLKKRFEMTDEAFEYYFGNQEITANKKIEIIHRREIIKESVIEIIESDIKIKKTKKIRKNASKRKNLPKEIRLKVYERSGGICEESDCENLAKAIHHIISVKIASGLQFVFANLIHLCLSCHRKRHPDLPDILFK